MKRRTLIKSLTLVPLAGAVGASQSQAKAEPTQTHEWTPKKRLVRKTWTTNNPAAPSVLSGCIRSGHLLFVSGIGGWYPDHRAEPGDIKVQIQSALTIMKEVLEEAGSSMANVLKVHMTIAEPNKNIALLNEGYRGFFPDPPPARSYTGCGVDQMGRDGILVQVDCVAYVD
jgi:enamine deaminase RidA (YjgF/YER057c/UK114 family)